MKKYLFNFALLAMLLEGTMQIRAQITGLNYNAEGDYYEISSSADMEILSKYVRAYKGNTCAGCTIKVIVDSIALSDNFVMIGKGNASSQDFEKRPFSGVFDGQGAAISWGKKKFSTPSHALFAYLLGGTVKNVRLYVNFEGGANALSGLVLNNYGGTISDCVVNGSIEGNIGVAGIVYSNGYMTKDDENTYGTISNCVSNVHLKGSQKIGGIVNSNYGEVINCVNNGVFECGSGYVGGIAADNHSSGTISYCRNENPVISTNYQNTGGIVGSNAGTVEYCENFAFVESTDYFTGGIVGLNSGGLVNHCTNSKDVRATNTQVGGIVGANWNGMISDCLMTSGSVSGNSYVGAIVGQNRSILSENYYYEEVTVSDNTDSYFQTQPRGRGSVAGDPPIDVTEQTVNGVTYYNGAVLYQPEDKTAIGRVASQVSDNDAPIYTLQGFRVAPGSLQGRKGLFIKRSNGRKSVVKRH